MSRLIAFLISAIILIGDCGSLIVNREDLKIIGGEDANITDYPYAVSLQYNGTFFGHTVDHFCGGSVLNERWIITSAQCALMRTRLNYHIRVGTNTYFKGGQIYEIDEIVIHPKYTSVFNDFDVGLLKLLTPIAFDSNVQPISLPTRDYNIPDDSELSIAGWGATEPIGRISDTLKETRVHKISNENCISAYENAVVTDRMFCVFTKGFGSCIGDSGSPAVLSGKLMGLASWSYGCAYKYPTAYANLPKVVDWIHEVMNSKSVE